MVWSDDNAVGLTLIHNRVQLLHLLAGRPGHADHGLGRPVEEEQFGEEQLLEGQFTGLADQVDVATEAVHAVDIRQLKEHDVLDAADRLQADQSADDEDHRHVESDDAATSHTGAAAAALVHADLCLEWSELPWGLWSCWLGAGHETLTAVPRSTSP